MARKGWDPTVTVLTVMVAIVAVCFFAVVVAIHRATDLSTRSQLNDKYVERRITSEVSTQEKEIVDRGNTVDESASDEVVY